MDITCVRTIGDLNEYLYDHPSPVVVDIFRQVIQFFSYECRKEDGKKDWKAIQERKRMGLGFQLTEHTNIDATVVLAFRNWLLSPYGRNCGTSFLDAMVSHVIGKISNPREEVRKILDCLHRSTMREVL